MKFKASTKQSTKLEHKSMKAISVEYYLVLNTSNIFECMINVKFV